MGGFTVNEELVYLGADWKIVGTVRGQAVGGTDGIFYPVLTDQIGTPRVVLDPATGDARWTWEGKEAFGLDTPNETPGTAGVFTFNARFPGQWFDPETGLYQNGYRDYDPRTGRYVESDPVGLGGGWNTYSYGASRPTQTTDSLGLRFKFAPGSSVEDQKKFMEARAALEALPGMRRTIQQIIDSPEEYTIDMNPKGLYRKDVQQWGYGHYATDEKTIHWNPRLGANLGGDGCMSPAFILGHEMNHIVLEAAGIPGRDQEQMIIRGFEKEYHGVYGGATRTSHAVKASGYRTESVMGVKP